MKNIGLSICCSILLFSSNVLAYDKIKTLEEKIQIQDFDVDLKLDIYKDQKEEVEVLLKLENIIKKIPKEKDKVEEYYQTQIKYSKIPYIKNQLVLKYGEYIKKTKAPKNIQKGYEKLLLINGLTEKTLGELYYELMKIGYERYGNVKANYYYGILEKNFPNKEILTKAKKTRINILIKENNLTKARRVIINELKNKDERMQLFLLVNLLDVNIKLNKTKNIGIVLEKTLESLRFNKSKEAKELINEIVEIEQKDLDVNQRKYFDDFYNSIYENSVDFVEGIVVPAMIKDIETLLKLREWKQANKKLLTLLQYYLPAKEYELKKFDYYVTNYLMDRITFKTLKDKYPKVEIKEIKEDLKVLEMYENLKNSKINEIKNNLEKLIMSDVRTLNKYGLEKGVLIENMLKLYIKRFTKTNYEEKNEAINFFKKYSLIKNKFDLLNYDEKLNLVKKVLNNKRYINIKKDISEYLKKKENKTILDKYINTMLLIKEERWANAANEIEEIDKMKPLVKEDIIDREKFETEKDRILNKLEVIELEKLYIDTLIRMNTVEKIKREIKKEVRRRKILDIGVFLDNLWKGYNYLKNNNIDFMKKAIIIRMINVSNSSKVFSYRPEIDYELQELLLNEGVGYDFQALQVLLNVEKSANLMNKLNTMERQKLFYTIGRSYEDMFLANSAVVYYELCKEQENPSEDIYTKLCSEKSNNLKEKMIENNINFQ